MPGAVQMTWQGSDVDGADLRYELKTGLVEPRCALSALIDFPASYALEAEDRLFRNSGMQAKEGDE